MIQSMDSVSQGEFGELFGHSDSWSRIGGQWEVGSAGLPSRYTDVAVDSDTLYYPMGGCEIRKWFFTDAH